MAVRIRDVADRAGVSPSTVSYVLNGGPRKVSDEVSKKVLLAIDELQFRPSGVARNMRKSQTNAIGIPPGIVKPGQRITIFMEAMLAGITEASWQAGKDVVLFTSTHELSGQELARCILDQRADGFIFLDLVLQATAVEIAAREGLPHVVVYATPDAPSPYIKFDNHGGTRQALEHLYGLGHRRIAHIHGQRGDQDADERLSAYYEFMWEHKLPILEHWVEGGVFEPTVAEQTGYEAMGRVLQANIRPTAVFSANDAMIPGVYKRLRESGIDVPTQLSIVGYDDTYHARECWPKLTTIQQDFKSIGALAVEKLMQIESGEPGPLCTVHPVSLIVRDSTGAPMEG